jgi:hypothetical protein
MFPGPFAFPESGPGIGCGFPAQRSFGTNEKRDGSARIRPVFDFRSDQAAGASSEALAAGASDEEAFSRSSIAALRLRRTRPFSS